MSFQAIHTISHTVSQLFVLRRCYVPSSQLSVDVERVLEHLK